ncbi:unnamed protein product [Haemonchus placei]|uniref:Str_synth domain-containing protein n=1 Tax=Haemonchus placei TaxID=6290 RepID=A0A158QPS7_HAEPC|nr:unnamed protein product [Haemonchus placei]
MHLVVVICLTAIAGNGALGLGVHQTKPDPELPEIHVNPNLGEDVTIQHNHKDVGEPPKVPIHPDFGSEIELSDDIITDSVVEKNGPSLTQARPLSPFLPPHDERPISPTAASKGNVRPGPPAPPPKKSGNACPSRVSAFCTVRDQSYLFSDGYVYIIRNDRIQSVRPIDHIFPGGPHFVNAAVYDKEKRLVVLIEKRQVYAYRPVSNGKFELDPTYPKELTSSVAFTPTGAMRWHDRRQVLLSDDGRFAMYDEYWNKSLITAHTEDYFLGLPHNVRGISNWENDEGKIYTHNLVFVYKVLDNAVAGDGIPLSTFLHCQ